MNSTVPDLVILPIPVNAWNAIKFILFELIVSLAFAPLWTRFIRSKCHKIVETDGKSATLFDSQIGRLTPASVMAYRTDATLKLGCHRFDMKYISRIVLLLVNLFLLSSILLTEYGSGSRFAYEVIVANITDSRKHSALAESILKQEISTSKLSPLFLGPQDYSYTDEQQQAIDLEWRVRNVHKKKQEAVTMKNATKLSRRIALCGISSTSSKCDRFPPSGNETVKEPAIFRIGKVEKLSDKFADIQTNFLIARNVTELGVGRKLYGESRNYTMDCIVHRFNVVRANYDTYLPHACTVRGGKYDHFFFMEPMKGLDVFIFLHGKQHLQNQTEFKYTATRIYSKSLFGVESTSIPSRDVSLFQVWQMESNLFEYKEFLGQNENIFMDSLKERILWALLGMVSGNSSVEKVEVESDTKLATLNVFFAAGSVCVLLILFTLALLGSQVNLRTKKISIPIASGELLQKIREIDSRNHGMVYQREEGWPELFINQLGELSFSGAGPLSNNRIRQAADDRRGGVHRTCELSHH